LQEEAISRTTDVGHGLLVAGGAIIPFKDEWPKGKLYDLWNTKPEEIAEQKRKLLQAKPAWTGGGASSNVDGYQDPFEQEGPATGRSTESASGAEDTATPYPSEDIHANPPAARPGQDTIGSWAPAGSGEPDRDAAGASAPKAEIARIERVAAHIRANGAWNGKSAELIGIMGEDVNPSVFTKLLIKHAQHLEELGVSFRQTKRRTIQLVPVDVPEAEDNAAEQSGTSREASAQCATGGQAAPDYSGYQDPFVQEAPAPGRASGSAPSAQEPAHRVQKEGLLDEMGFERLAAQMLDVGGPDPHDTQTAVGASPDQEREETARGGMNATRNEPAAGIPDPRAIESEVRRPVERPAALERRKSKAARGNRPAFVECRGCGAVIAGDSAFCPKCGAKQ
jgi:rubrerythrin